MKLCENSLAMNWRCKRQQISEFQRANRIGKKKTGETRPVIVRFLRFPERELVFRRVRELADDIDIKVYADFQRNKRKKEKAVATS